MNDGSEAVISVAAVNAASRTGHSPTERRSEHSAGRDQYDKPAAELGSVRQHYEKQRYEKQHYEKPVMEHRSDNGTMREHYDRLANERAQALAEASLLKA